MGFRPSSAKLMVNPFQYLPRPARNAEKAPDKKATRPLMGRKLRNARAEAFRPRRFSRNIGANRMPRCRIDGSGFREGIR
jgi:hypothetical protein